MSWGSFFRHQHPTNVLLWPVEALLKPFFRLNGVLSYEMTAFMLCASTTQILRSLFRLWKGERGKRRSEGENNSNYIWYWQTLWLVIAEKQTGKISCQPLPVYPSPIKWAADSICVHLCVCLRVQENQYMYECSSFSDNVHTKIHLL